MLIDILNEQIWQEDLKISRRDSHFLSSVDEKMLHFCNQTPPSRVVWKQQSCKRSIVEPIKQVPNDTLCNNSKLLTNNTKHVFKS